MLSKTPTEDRRVLTAPERAPSGSDATRIIGFMMLTFLVILLATVATWYLQGGDKEHHLHEVMGDALKVSLGALIGIMTQWAAFAFRHPAGTPAPGLVRRSGPSEASTNGDE